MDQSMIMFESHLGDTTNIGAEMAIHINLLELGFLVFFIFELGFLVGKQSQLKWIVRMLMGNRSQHLLPPPEDDIKKSPSLSQDSTASECLTMVADKQNLDPQNVENLFFQQKLPFQAPKRNTKANFQLTLERRGSSLFKVQKYEQVSQFECSSSLAMYEFNKLRQTIKRVSQTQNEGDKNGIQLKLSRSGTSNKTEVLFKRLSFKEPENHRIQIEGLCENGKFKALFQNIKKIGEGGFGSVYQATHKVEKKQYAIKKIYLKDLKKKDLLREVTIVNHLTQANIVRYYTWWIQQVAGPEQNQVQIPYDLPPPQLGLKRAISINSIPISSNSSNHSIIFADSSRAEGEQSIVNHRVNQVAHISRQREASKVYSLHIQMQLYKDGTLSQYLKSKDRKINPATAFSIVKELFNGLEFLHAHGVIHRDLKPANVFLDHREKLIKIGDFGLSVFVDKEVSIGEYLLSNRLGTPCYMAPEIKETARIPQPQLLDVYSLGVIYYELLKKFGSEHERVTKLKQIQSGRIDLEEYATQRQLIRMMTRSHKSRLQIPQLRETKQWKELEKRHEEASWIGNSAN